VIAIAPLPPGVGPSDRVVLFDGDCVLCNSGAQALMRADPTAKFKLGTIQSDEGKKLLEWHGIDTEAPDTFILSDGPQLYVRSTAYVRILWSLALPYKCVAGLCWIVPRPVRDAMYNWVARNRFKMFGKQSTCVLLTKAQRAHCWSPISDDQS
jgi:predicted DCC family thiol-disulfide oxidoreductase YuxK